MTREELLRELRHRPAVHQLCQGAYLQSAVRLPPKVIAIPLRNLGFQAEANYVGQYVRELVDDLVDAEGLEEFARQAQAARPVIAIVCQQRLDAPPEDLEAAAQSSLSRAREVLSWATTDPVQPFAMVVARLDGTHYRPLPPGSRRLRRLGFGNTGEDFQRQLDRIVDKAEEDDRFAFALSLFRNAMYEPNTRFQIARLFNVLECLSYKIKGRTIDGVEMKSRRAVRYLCGFEPEEMAKNRATTGGQEYEYDDIETGGQVRDHLFHGSPVSLDRLPKEARDGYELYRNKPEILTRALISRCQIQLARWANDASRGQNPPEG